MPRFMRHLRFQIPRVWRTVGRTYFFVARKAFFRLRHDKLKIYFCVAKGQIVYVGIFHKLVRGKDITTVRLRANANGYIPFSAPVTIKLA